MDVLGSVYCGFSAFVGLKNSGSGLLRVWIPCFFTGVLTQQECSSMPKIIYRHQKHIPHGRYIPLMDVLGNKHDGLNVIDGSETGDSAWWQG